jgi:hypothetical protein
VDEAGFLLLLGGGGVGIMIRAGHVKHLLLLHGEHLHTIIIIIISLFYVLFISLLFESVFELVSI